MSEGQDHNGRRFRPASLDALNFLLSDVRGALGPYLNVFLASAWLQCCCVTVRIDRTLATKASRIHAEATNYSKCCRRVPSSYLPHVTARVRP